MTSRRSFLAMLGGVVAAPVILRAAPAAGRRDPFYTHFMIWDSVTFNPGEQLDEKLFCSPTPKKFLLTEMGLALEQQASYHDSCAVMRCSNFEITAGGLCRMRGALGLNHPAGTRLGFVDIPFAGAHMGFAFNVPADFSVRIRSMEPVQSKLPVSLMVTLKGLVEH